MILFFIDEDFILLGLQKIVVLSIKPWVQDYMPVFFLKGVGMSLLFSLLL